MTTPEAWILRNLSEHVLRQFSLPKPFLLSRSAPREDVTSVSTSEDLEIGTLTMEDYMRANDWAGEISEAGAEYWLGRIEASDSESSAYSRGICVHLSQYLPLE